MGRLMKKHEDEALVDECLMLPHKVMIPALDTVQGSRGLAACITSQSSPITFVLGQEPDLPPITPPPFMEGLSYTEDQNSNLFYDSIQKMYLGECFFINLRNFGGIYGKSLSGKHPSNIK